MQDFSGISRIFDPAKTHSSRRESKSNRLFIGTQLVETVKKSRQPVLFLLPNGKPANVALYRIKAAVKVPFSSLQLPLSESNRGRALKRSQETRTERAAGQKVHVSKIYQGKNLKWTKRGESQERTKEESFVQNVDRQYKASKLYDAPHRATLPSPQLGADTVVKSQRLPPSSAYYGDNDWDPSNDPIWASSSPPTWKGSRAPGDALSSGKARKVEAGYNGEWEYLHLKALSTLDHLSLLSKIGTNHGPVQIILALRPSSEQAIDAGNNSSPIHDRRNLLVKR